MIVLRLNEIGLEFNLWYLDDGILCGTVSCLKEALTLLQQHLPAQGLELNLAKCKLFGPGAFTHDPAFQGIPRVPANEGTPIAIITLLTWN